MNNKSVEDEGYRVEAFYLQPFKFSFSSLSLLLEAPSMFYKEYVLGPRTIKDAEYLVMGRLIHCLLLEPERQHEKFVLSPTDIPGGEGKNVIDRIFELYTELPEEDKAFTTLENFAPEILTILKEINLHQRLTDDGKRLAKIIDEKNINYFDFLKQKGSKDLIDPDMLDNALKAVSAIKNNKSLVELLGVGAKSDFITTGIYNELYLEMDLPGYPFGLKGIIDNINITNKTININDFKTSSKVLSKFPESVELYRYWLQAVLYRILVKNFLAENNIDIDNGEWTVNMNFVVCDRYNQVYAFEVSKETFEKWSSQLNSVLEQALYHYNERDYTLPYEFATGKVTL